MSKIVIKLDTDGGVEAEAIGYKGSACSVDIHKVMKGLSKKGAVEKRKPEYYEENTEGLKEETKW